MAVTMIVEAATIRMRARGAARALRELLSEKELPEGLREQVENLFQAMGKTWEELAGGSKDLTAKDAKGEGEEDQEEVEEASNVGQWFEGSIHQAFTNMADDWFKSGLLTREERIGLSSAIGEALSAFVAKLTADFPELYLRQAGEEVSPAQPMAMGELTEGGILEGDCVELVERAVRGDGTMMVKLIQPGWGSSGYYPQDVLERDGPKVFGKGTKMYWNHPTAEEERARPEGDLRNLAAELVGDARWDANGTAGAGLYAEAKVFGDYRQALEELAPHIGLSIRASGKGTRGLAEGREGLVLSGITGARSVDFVTLPGAGGQVVSLFEGKRLPAFNGLHDERGSRDSADKERPSTNTERSSQNDRNKGEEELSMEEKKELEDLRGEKVRLEEEVRKLAEGAAMRRVGEMAAEELREAVLPEATKSRIVRDVVNGAMEAMVIKGAVVDEARLKEVIQEKVKGEKAYLEAVGAAGNGRQAESGIRGMGTARATTRVDPTEGVADLEEVFRGMGMGEREAKEAARGRG